jgi:hypothetical protein
MRLGTVTNFAIHCNAGVEVVVPMAETQGGYEKVHDVLTRRRLMDGLYYSSMHHVKSKGKNV